MVYRCSSGESLATPSVSITVLGASVSPASDCHAFPASVSSASSSCSRRDAVNTGAYPPLLSVITKSWVSNGAMPSVLKVAVRRCSIQGNLQGFYAMLNLSNKPS